MINLLNKAYGFIKMINLLNKTNVCKRHHKFVNQKWKGVKSEKIKIFPLVCSEYLSSWTGLGKSGHDQITTFGSISHVSGSKLSF